MGSLMRRARSATAAKSRTSRAWAVGPAREVSWAASAGLRQQAWTRQPAAAYWRVNSRPRPRLAPVKRTVGIGVTSTAGAFILSGGVRLPEQVRLKPDLLSGKRAA